MTEVAEIMASLDNDENVDAHRLTYAITELLALPSMWPINTLIAVRDHITSTKYSIVDQQAERRLLFSIRDYLDFWIEDNEDRIQVQGSGR